MLTVAFKDSNDSLVSKNIELKWLVGLVPRAGKLGQKGENMPPL